MLGECCSSLLPGQILEVGQSLIILLAILKEDVQVPVWLLGSLRHIESMLIISCRPADLHTGEDSAGIRTTDGILQVDMQTFMWRRHIKDHEGCFDRIAQGQRSNVMRADLKKHT